jgi:segregation and condensation protein B
MTYMEEDQKEEEGGQQEEQQEGQQEEEEAPETQEEPQEETYDQSAEDVPEAKKCEPETTSEQTPAKIITHSTASEIETEFEDKETESEEKVEAALFISGRFLNLQDLIMLTDINPIMLKQILTKLERKYSQGAIKLVARNNSWKMDVSEKYHYMINKLATGSTEFTKAEQETLAVIAYKQPVKQSIIIKIRGNKAYDHVKKFKEIGLVIAKRIGHTYELNLSEEFYEYFNVHKKDSASNQSFKEPISQEESSSQEQESAKE